MGYHEILSRATGKEGLVHSFLPGNHLLRGWEFLPLLLDERGVKNLGAITPSPAIWYLWWLACYKTYFCWYTSRNHHYRILLWKKHTFVFYHCICTVWKWWAVSVFLWHYGEDLSINSGNSYMMKQCCVSSPHFPFLFDFCQILRDTGLVYLVSTLLSIETFPMFWEYRYRPKKFGNRKKVSVSVSKSLV